MISRPSRHRTIYFDLRAQRVFGPVLKSDVNANFFSPREIMMHGTWPSNERHDANDPEPADTVSQ